VNNTADELGLCMSCKLKTVIAENKDELTESFNERLSAKKERRDTSKAAKAQLPPVVQQLPAPSRATRAKSPPQLPQCHSPVGGKDPRKSTTLDLYRGNDKTYGFHDEINLPE
jgi:hypothetical protein